MCWMWTMMLYKNLNKAMISIEKVENKYDKKELRDLIEAHVAGYRFRNWEQRCWMTLMNICLNFKKADSK